MMKRYRFTTVKNEGFWEGLRKERARKTARVKGGTKGLSHAMHVEVLSHRIRAAGATAETAPN
jgi:hypothetical protein